MKNTITYLFLIVFMFTALNVVRAQQDSQISNPLNEHYFYQNDEKVFYPSRPNELLVIIKSNENIAAEKDISEFEDIIKSQGLVIYKTFLEPPTDPTQIMKYNSYRPLIRKKIIVKKKDGSAFNRESSIELAILRKLEKVEFAGPLIMTDDNYYDAFTYDHYIKVEAPLKSMQINEFKKFVKEIDERYFFDEKTYRIVLPLETNENVPQIMEKFYQKDIPELMKMSFVKFIRSSSVLFNQNSQPKSTDSLEADYYFVGGVRVVCFKDLNRIGIAFQPNSNDFSKFLNKYDLEFDRRFNYRSFNVFRFTEDISIEERKEIIESINREENLKLAGDLLFNQISAAIITNQIIIQWKESDLEKRKEFLILEGIEENEKNGRFSILELQNAYNYRVIEVCKKLVNSGLAHIAEPNLLHNVVLD